jgi:hypothetical protein
MVRNLQIYMTIALLGVAQCCIFKFGSNPEELVSWPGIDKRAFGCCPRRVLH